MTPWVHKYDRQKKWDNEVDIMLAPDYEPVEEWEKKPLFEVEDEDEEGEEGEDGEGDDDEEWYLSSNKIWAVCFQDR